jgi:hypothetical protein
MDHFIWIDCFGYKRICLIHNLFKLLKIITKMEGLEKITGRTFKLNEAQLMELGLAEKGYFQDFPPSGVVKDPCDILGVHPGERISRRGYDLLRTTLIYDSQ